MKEFNVVSLFSGCGGMDLGFCGGFTYLLKKYKKLSFKTILANDIDKNACLTYSKNFTSNVVCEDINVLLKEKKELFKKTDVLLGGFPCQDFSHAGKRKGLSSKRGNLYKSMAEAIKITNPKIFIGENVKGLLTIDNGKTIKKIVNDYKEIGYNVKYKLLHTADYEVPQNRERVIIVGVRNDINIDYKFPEPVLVKSKWMSIEKAIKDLEKVAEGMEINHYWSKAKKNKGQGNNVVVKEQISPTIRAEHHGNIEFHWNENRRLSAREAARIQTFPDNFIFYPSTSSAYKQIGNAVPPVFAWYIANSVNTFLSSL